MNFKSSIGCICLALGSAMSSAQSAPPADGSAPPTPPREAFTACSGKQAGDKVTVTMGPHTVEATCEVFPGTGALAARPSGNPPPKPQ